MKYSFFRAHKRDLTIAAVVAVIVMLGQSVIDGSMVATIISLRPSVCRYGMFQSRCTMPLRKTTPSAGITGDCGMMPSATRCPDGKMTMKFVCNKQTRRWESLCPAAVTPSADQEPAPARENTGTTGEGKSAAPTYQAPSPSGDTGQGKSAEGGGGASAAAAVDWRDDPSCRCSPAMGMPNWKCADGTIGGPHCMRKADGTCGWLINNCPQPKG